MLVTLYLAVMAVACATARGAVSPRSYAHRLVLHRWHSEAEWQALDAIVRPESGWNPCRHYPSTTDCFYTGSNSCGIPQANPCPVLWRGRLGRTWRAQVRWVVAYISHRYGSPKNALIFRRAHGWY